MKKLTILIADSDENYIKNLEKYLRVNHSEKLDVSYFTTPEHLFEFLEKGESKADILLYGFSIKQNKNLSHKVSLSIPLDETRSYHGKDTFNSVYKFQHADKIISDILVIYSKINNDFPISSGQKLTKIIAVFSSIGGSGKSTIAAACSIMLAKRGLKVFYLNVEKISSTEIFFTPNCEENFSKIIYYLKEGKKKIDFKLEAAKSVDPENKVHFFVSSENMMDNRELDEDEFVALLSCISDSSQYDYIFIDMSEGLDKLNLEALIMSDIIIKVSVPGKLCEYKNNELQSAFRIVEKRYSTDIDGKTLNVINKTLSGNNFIQNSQETGYQVFINETLSQRLIENPKEILSDINFSKDINYLIERICDYAR